MLDQMDMAILKALQENARVSYREIAKTLNVSRVTVHERIKKLINRNVITRFSVSLNSEVLGYPVTAFVGLMTVQGVAAYKTLEDILAIPEVEEAHTVTGRYDYLIKVRAKNNKHLERILLEKIDQVHGFQRAETMVVLSSPVEKCGIDIRQVLMDAESATSNSGS